VSRGPYPARRIAIHHPRWDTPAVAPAPDLIMRPLNGEDFAPARAVADAWFGRPVGLTFHRLFFEQLGPFGLWAERREAPGRLAGLLLGLPSAAEQDLAYIHLHMVDPDLRGRGVGGALYREFGRRAAAAGRSRVRALAAPSNVVSVRFHRSLGFTGTPSPGHVGPGQDRIVFERTIPFG
jgi:ribosomal protein S18 acetylase RimI-like enzyme